MGKGVGIHMSTPKNILITPRSLSKNGHQALKALEDAGFTLLMPWPGKQPSEEELLEILPECVGYLAGVEKISREVLLKCQKLQVISRNGVGIDNVDVLAAKEMGIQVVGTPGANSQGVAELALSLLLASFRSIAWSSSRIKAGSWERNLGVETSGKTLGIIGCGQIGFRLAHMAIGIGMRVLGYDMFQNAQLADLPGFSYVSLEELVQNSDGISLHCPPGETPLVNASFLETAKSGVCIINTARAGLVDTEALYKALNSGKVSHYATDVYPTEPPVLDKLLLHEHTTLTPHIGGFTSESVQRATEAAVANLITGIRIKS